MAYREFNKYAALRPMTITCTRCSEEVSTERNNIQSVALDVGFAILKLYCIACKVCIAIQSSETWRLLEEYFRSCDMRNGWYPMTQFEDYIVVYAMSQIFYNEWKDETDPVFDFPDQGDHVKIFWKDGKAVGFYSVKPKGTVVASTHEVYASNTLDTSFVLPSSRGFGIGLSMFQDMVVTYPGEDIAVSTPISKSMAHVIRKFLQNEISYRTKLWEITGVGGAGSRKLLCYTVNDHCSK